MHESIIENNNNEAYLSLIEPSLAEILVVEVRFLFLCIITPEHVIFGLHSIFIAIVRYHMTIANRKPSRHSVRFICMYVCD